MKKPVAKKPAKPSTFHLLEVLESRDLSALDNMSEADRKALGAYMPMRWMAGSDNPRQVVFINALVNQFIWNLPQNKDGKSNDDIIRAMLMICGSGQSGWRKRKFRKLKGESSAKISAIKAFFEYTTKEAVEAAGLLTDEQVIDIAEQLGYGKEEMKKLRDELK